jgi:DNA-binding NtrC family response regulator
MGQAQQTRRAVLIVEDDAELRSLTAALLEDEQLDTIECESGRSCACRHADRWTARCIDLRRHSAAWRHGWGRSGARSKAALAADSRCSHLGASARRAYAQFPPGVAYIPKPWQPLNLLVAAEEALALLH